MLALLLKRQARARKEQEKHEAPEQATSEKPQATRLAFEDKDWQDVQNSLKNDLEFARTLAGSQEKVPYKKELIKKYKPVVTKLLKTHESLDGLDVIWWFYQWQIDCGLLPLMHDEFKAAVLKGLNTPSNWKANSQTTYCDIIYKYSNEAYKAKVEFNRTYLSDAINDLLSGDIAINAPLKVKMFRLAGDLLLDAGNQEQAMVMFEIIMKIDPAGGGRKKKLKELQELLNDGK